MARTPLAGRLQEAAAVAREATERGVPVDQLLDGRVSRRDLIKKGRSAPPASAR